MADISCDIVVVGAGVLGLCVASELTARGYDVRVVDPGGLNASAVAAGMIAPAAETLLDDLGGDRPAMLRDAAALWPDLAERAGIRLDRSAAAWLPDQMDGDEADLVLMGFEPERDGRWLRLPSDVRLDPEQALAGLTGLLEWSVVRRQVTGVEPRPGSWRLRLDDSVIHARAIVLATGTSAALPGLPQSVAEVIAHVRPISGQIGRAPGAPTPHVLRGRGGYVVPTEGGAILIGATMVEGPPDMTPDPSASKTLIAVAETYLGTPVVGPVLWRVGVRGASPDGLPMAGPTDEPSIHVALAPRRNGWLLGPLVARVVANGIEGRPRGRYATAFDPLRFSPPRAG